MGNEYDFCPGDLVHLREWNDDVGWVVDHSIIFMVVSQQRDATGESNRDVVHVVGGGYNIETFSGYFVRAVEGPCQSSS